MLNFDKLLSAQSVGFVCQLFYFAMLFYFCEVCTISQPARIEIFKRLAKLNKERWEEEEKAGLHKKKGKK